MKILLILILFSSCATYTQRLRVYSTPENNYEHKIIIITRKGYFNYSRTINLHNGRGNIACHDGFINRGYKTLYLKCGNVNCSWRDTMSVFKRSILHQRYRLCRAKKLEVKYYHEH